MPAVNTYRKPASNLTIGARWLWLGLFFSALIHFGFYLVSTSTRMQKFGEDYYEQIVPRAFHLKRVEINPKLLEAPLPDSKPEKAEPLEVRRVEIPKDAKPLENELKREILVSPALKKTENPLAKSATPEATSLAVQMSETKSLSSQALAEELDAARKRLIDDKPDVKARSLENAASPQVRKTEVNDKSLRAQGFAEELGAGHQHPIDNKPAANGRPILDASGPQTPMTDLSEFTSGIGSDPAKDGGLSSGARPPGYSDLDTILGQSGPLAGNQAPILMPTDLLFDYNQSTLRPEALESLRKLGTIIQRNPNSTFRIEGHTDSFGSENYNQALSKQRAESVKQWLVENMGIVADRIGATGLGKTRLLVSGAGTVEQQSLNRRVEIVIHTK